jgi:DNA-binding MarR family transcriptional regulator
MSLEQDILQDKFQNEYEKLAVNILYTASWLHSANSARLKQFDITPEQFNVLRILRGSHPKPLMLADITARMIDKNSNATRLVDKLRQKGMVKRELCATSRRQVDISITAKGLSVLKSIDARQKEWIATLKKVKKAEAEAINALLDKVRGK